MMCVIIFLFFVACFVEVCVFTSVSVSLLLSVRGRCCAVKYFLSKEKRNLFIADNPARHQGKKISKGNLLVVSQFCLEMKDLEIAGQSERKLESCCSPCKTWPFSLEMCILRAPGCLSLHTRPLWIPVPCHWVND